MDEATHEFDHLDLPAIPEHILDYDGQRITAEGDWFTHAHPHNHPPGNPVHIHEWSHRHEHRYDPDRHHHELDPADEPAAAGHAADPHDAAFD
jgi:hypothetical protein